MNGMVGVMVDQAVEDAFDKFDTNKDGVLTLEEFKIWALSDERLKITLHGMESEVPATLFAGMCQNT